MWRFVKWTLLSVLGLVVLAWMWPILWTGITSIKPTQGVVPWATEIPPQDPGIAAQLMLTDGPMARHVADVRAASAVQLLASLAVTLPLALLEPEAMDWQPGLVAAMAWSVLGLTLGGSSLLYLLIQRGASTQVTSLLYLVPPCTAALAWWFFGEAFTPLMMLGMLLTVCGVAMVVRDRG